MSNKCNAACKSFTKTIKNMVVGAVISTFTTINDPSDRQDNAIFDHQDGRTYVQNLDPEDNKKHLLRPEKPCAPAPVTKVTPQGTITTMEVPPDCPGKYLDTTKT